MDPSTSFNFNERFKALTGHSPFCWQQRLHDHFARGDFPARLDIPTGLGKTSVMAIWYLALKGGAKVPRRLVYVVDRRAVVDQATTEADNIREKSQADNIREKSQADNIREKSQDVELRVSTLRGQHVDNRDWLESPDVPAIIVGTVDMIGSRLLFSGYGVSRKMRPYHAGLLGADTLIVLDEAHLVPPFEKLLRAMEDGGETFGPRDEDDRKIIPPFKLLSLSATGREDSTGGPATIFRLKDEDRDDAEVEKRLSARKKLAIKVLGDKPELVKKLADQAWSLGKEQGPARVLVYCHSRDDAVKVKQEIDKKFKSESGKAKPVSELLVGGRRVYEREQLAKWLREHGFLGGKEAPPAQPTFLIATSAGEVGVDLDADHMVCDLVEWERMVQRLGRVNRRGNGDACIEVIAAPRKKAKEEGEERLARLLKPLDSLCQGVASGQHDASPGAILKLKKCTEQNRNLQDAIEAATTQEPLRPALTRALIDAWSMTSLDKHTGRPDDIQPWLRGWEEDQQSQTTVVWRKHLPVRKNGAEAAKKDVEAFFEAAPPHASEKLEIETSRAFDWLVKHSAWLVKHSAKAISSQSGEGIRSEDLLARDVIAYVLSPVRDLRHTILGSELIDSDKNVAKKVKDNLNEKLAGATLVVNARFGGLSEAGMLDEKATSLPRVIDDEQEWLPLKDDKPVIRFRVRPVTTEENTQTDEDWRERYRFTTEQSDEGEVQRFLLVKKWRHDAETEDDRSVGCLQTLTEHHAWTEKKARDLAKAIDLPDRYADMLAVAARLHDEGKRHEIWQRAAKAPQDGQIYAKTDRRMNPWLLNGYRHEFGSLPCAEKDKEFKALPADLQDLALHVVAAHHGRARPVISTNGCDEPPSVLEGRARDIALRFARLQKRWGPWGLAWWEALLRAADQQASRDAADQQASRDNDTPQVAKPPPRRTPDD